MNTYKHTYTTTAGRILLTDKDLSYALNKNGLVDPALLKPGHTPKCIDAPNEESANTIRKALNLLQNLGNSKAPLAISLFDTAQKAAYFHQKCLATQNNTTKITNLSLYLTNRRRYVLTSVQEFERLDQNPGVILENSLTEDDFSKAVFFPACEWGLAMFLRTCALGSFLAADEDIPILDFSTLYHANRFSLMALPYGGSTCIFRDGKCKKTLTANTTHSEKMGKLMLRAAEYQLAICQFYLSTQAAS